MLRATRLPQLDALLHTWVSTTSHYNNAALKDFVSGISVNRGRMVRFESSVDRLEARIGGCNRPRRVARAPSNKWPRKEQNQRQQNRIAIRAIERVRLREQFRGAAEKRSAGNNEEAAENVEAHNGPHAENENTEQNYPGEELFCKPPVGTPPSPHHTTTP